MQTVICHSCDLMITGLRPETAARIIVMHCDCERLTVINEELAALATSLIIREAETVLTSKTAPAGDHTSRTEP